MRLVQARVRELTVLRAKTSRSDYVGTETEYIPHAVIRAEVQPLSAALGYEQRGQVVTRGVLVYCDTAADIRESDRFSWGGDEYSVKSVLPYGNIKRLEAEKVGG